MQEFALRLIITIGLIWLTQTLLDAFGIQEPARKIVFIVTLLILIWWLVLGHNVVPVM